MYQSRPSDANSGRPGRSPVYNAGLLFLACAEDAMPRRDETEILDAPGLRADPRTGGSRPAPGSGRPPTGRHEAVHADAPISRVLIIVALCLAVGVGAWTALIHRSLGQARVELGQAQSRIAELERQLSSSDESWSQSSVAMQVKLKDVADKTDTLWKEMDKLWASAWRRNQKDIGDQAELLKKQDALLKSQAQAVAGLRQELQTQGKSLGERAGSLEKSLAARQKAIDESLASLNRMAAEQGALSKRVQTNEEWIESINAHRRQINQQLESLRQSLASSRPAAPAQLQ